MVAVPTQEPKNKKTNMVFMLVQRPEGFIASNQTGNFPRTSNRGMQYICVFYIHDTNYIKAIPIKKKKRKNCSDLTKKSMHIVKAEALGHNYTKWIMKRQGMLSNLLQEKK